MIQGDLKRFFGGVKQINSILKKFVPTTALLIIYLQQETESKLHLFGQRISSPFWGWGNQKCLVISEYRLFQIMFQILNKFTHFKLIWKEIILTLTHVQESLVHITILHQILPLKMYTLWLGQWWQKVIKLGKFFRTFYIHYYSFQCENG